MCVLERERERERARERELLLATLQLAKVVHHSLPPSPSLLFLSLSHSLAPPLSLTNNSTLVDLLCLRARLPVCVQETTRARDNTSECDKPRYPHAQTCEARQDRRVEVGGEGETGDEERAP